MFRTMSFLLAFIIAIPALAADIQITDLTGRTVSLEKPAKTVVVGDGRVLPALALLDREDPVKRVVAILSDLKLTDPDLLSELKTNFPKMNSIPIYSGNSASTSAESIIQLAPEAAIFGLQDHGPGARNKELIGQLNAAGIAVVFIDFRQNPLENTLPSMSILGKLLGREKEANEYSEFYTNHKNAVSEKLAGWTGKRPSVFLQAHIGRMPCCIGMAKGMLGPFITFAGGENISAEVAPGMIGRHTLEFLLTKDPDVWIGTASGHREDYAQGKPTIILGAGIDAKLAEESLEIAIKSAGFAPMSAVKNGRVHGIWHNFYNSPLNIYALESIAKWLHPTLFADLDPDATLAEIRTRFMSLEMNGTYSVSLMK